MQTEIKLPLIKVVKALLVFAARGDVRYYLNGVHVRREGDGVLLEATDGHRLLRVWLTDTLGFDDVGTDLILCREQLDMAVKAYKDLRFSGLQLHDINLKTLDGRFPDVPRVLGREPREKATGVDLGLLSTSVKVLSLLSPFGVHEVKQVSKTSLLGQIEITGDFIGGRYHAVIMGARV